MATFTDKELRGSRLRCMMLTALSPSKVAESLTAITNGKAVVSPTGDTWQPRGFLEALEIQLGRSKSFLSPEQRATLMDWWLVRKQGARVPTWDIVSTCRIGEKPGLLLVEAKAHADELDRNGKSADSNVENHEKIRQAMLEANAGLCEIMPGWALTEASHYQLCNRFAWSWKLASMGIPVVLVYLGFLDAAEMVSGGRRLLRDADEWRDEVLKYSDGFIPPSVWGTELSIAGTPMCSAISTVDLVGAVQ